MIDNLTRYKSDDWTARIVLLLCCLSMSVTMWAQVYTPKEMPNVQVADRGQYISDPAGLLPADVKAEVNKKLWELRKETTVEAVVALPPDIGDEEPAQWCLKLFTLWGLGKKDKDNGLLIMISPGSRCSFIMTGYGLEGVLPDISCANIINKAIIPSMREDDLSAAVIGAVDLSYQALTDPAVAEELRSSDPDNFDGAIESLDPAVLFELMLYVGFLGLFCAFVTYIADIISMLKKKSNYEKSMVWRNHLLTYLAYDFCSVGLALPFHLLAFMHYRRCRTKKITCDTCGAKMNRLSEDKDNELLSPSQDKEEELKTVDYDVWLCPECGTVERFPYKKKVTKYVECPECHAIAKCLDKEVVIHPATEKRAGDGLRCYSCKFCGHKEEKRYRIRRKQSAGAVIAGAALGSLGGGRGGGGGGFGGGFGGGSTGGGGAGGSW